MKEDFIDKHTVSSIKEKLPHVMPVSCYRLGVDGANIVFQSKVSVFITHTNATEREYQKQSLQLSIIGPLLLTIILYKITPF